MFELIGLGNLLTILSFLVGGVAFAATIKSSVNSQTGRLSSIESEIQELRKVMITMARQEERLMALDQRMLAQGQRIDAQSARLTSLDQRINNNIILLRQKRQQENDE